MKNPTLLIVDTSTRCTVLGLTLDDEIIDRTTAAVNSHSRDILPSLQEMVLDAGIPLSDVDAFVFGQGPGSFTGLRIAAGIVQGLAYGLEKPVIQVSTMAALAQGFSGEAECVCVAMLARKQEVYFGAYRFEEGIARPVVDERVADIKDLPGLPSGDWVLTGDVGESLGPGVATSTGVSFSRIADRAVPGINELARLGLAAWEKGECVNALQVSPVYLREEVAAKPGQKG